jgi:hypothetical protein
MCLNKLLRPKTAKSANIYALERLFCRRSFLDDILSINKQSLETAANSVRFTALSAIKAKN